MPEIIGHPTILLVSGSIQTTRSINKLLSEHYRLLHAEDTQRAWDILQEQPSISLMICSLKKALDSNALLERVRQAKNQHMSIMPILLLVGENESEQQRDEGFAAGATDFVNMPFSTVELKTRVRLHTGHFSIHSQEQNDEIQGAAGNIDLLNTMMQNEVFISRLQQELSFSIRHKSYISISLLKITNADLISEQQSKKVFTAVLRALASLIEKQIRREDSYAYLGNATFALLFPVTNGLGANVALKRLMDKIGAMHLKHDGLDIRLTQCASQYSMMPSESLGSDDVMQTLQKRLTTAEQKGDAQIVSSQQEIEQSRLSIEQALNKIHYGHTEGLDKYLPDLLESLKPLLKYSRRHDEIGLQEILDSLDD